MSLYTYPSGEVTLLPPPDGYVADFDHPQRQYVQPIYWASGVLCVLSVLFMGQRVYTSAILLRKLFVEDVLLLFAWLLIILENALILRTVIDGTMGTHAYELVLDKFLQYMFNFYPMPIIYPLCIMFAKTSLLVFYLRLSPSKLFRYSVFFGIFLVAGSSIGLTLATAFPCKPLRVAWNPLVAGSCIDRPATYKATAALGLTADIYIILLPLPTIYGLRMPMQQKIGLVVVFAVGILTIVTSILRLTVIIKELSDSDVSWGSGPTAFWLIIEAYLMVICATLTSLRRFFRHIAPHLIGERASQGSASGLTPGGKADMVTFGGSNKKYKKFPHNELYGMDTINVTRIEEGPELDRDALRNAHNNGRDDQGSSGDGSSQKGILQIQTTSVTYEQQVRNESRGRAV